MKQHPDIVHELKDFAPTLASLQGRGCPFVIPIDATTDFEIKDWQEIVGQQEIETDFGCKTGAWAVPENYWANLSEEIFNNTITEVPQELAIAEISKLGGFTPPENYFDQLNAELFHKLEKESTAKEKKHAFRTPDAYFEGLEAQIFEKITAEKKRVHGRTVIINWRSIAIAAVLGGVIFSAVWLLKVNNTSIGVKPIEATAMNEQQVQEFVQEQASEADIQNMVEVSDHEATQEDELQKLLSKPQEKKIENKKAVLEEYITNEIDESTLTELL